MLILLTFPFLYFSVEACGSIAVEQYPSELGKVADRKVEIKSSSGKPPIDQILKASDVDGSFCAMVPIGAKVTFKVKTKEIMYHIISYNVYLIKKCILLDGCVLLFYRHLTE